MGSGANERLPEGLHEFEFEFKIPANDLPTSFEGKFGAIRYYLVAELDESYARSHKTIKGFTLISSVDINSEELAVSYHQIFEVNKTR